MKKVKKSVNRFSVKEISDDPGDFVRVGGQWGRLARVEESF